MKGGRRGGCRRYRVKLPGNPIIGEGKPENQNHAVIFARRAHDTPRRPGQLPEEAFKIRNLLEGFQGNVRLVGFREHLSESAVPSPPCGGQRVCVRYDRPAVYDVAADGASTTATPTCGTRCGSLERRHRRRRDAPRVGGHLRRDQRRRGGAVEYYEFIHCGKGATWASSPSTASSRRSDGHAMQLVSRDLYRLSKGVDLFRLLSFAGSGFCLPTAQTIWGLYCFTLQTILLLTGAFLPAPSVDRRPDGSGGRGGDRRGERAVSPN